LTNRRARRQAAKLSAPSRTAPTPPAEAAYALGLDALAAGRTLEALSAFEQVVQIEPHHAGALYQLGRIAYGAGRLVSAKGFFARAAAKDPGSAAAGLALARVLHDLGELRAAGDALEGVLALTPGDADVWMNLGNVRREQGAFTAAEAAGQRATALAPGSALAWRNLAVTLQEQGRAGPAIAAYERALAIDPELREAESGRLFCLNYDEDRTAGEVAREHRQWGMAMQARTPTSTAAWPNRSDPDRRIRIGYVSGDFHTHPVGYFLAEVLKAHDRSAVDVIGYSNGPRADAMTGRLRAACDHWRVIAGLDDAAADLMIRADAVDVLIDLSGHTAHGRLALFARRPAPVQASWLGYVATTGLPSMDYLITDAETAPFGSEALFTETLMRSPLGRFCYGPPELAPLVSPPPSARSRPFVFGSFNDTLKITPRVVGLWARVLNRVPGSQLLLKWRALDDEGVRQRLCEAFRRAGVEPSRLELRGYSPHQSMLAQYADMDVALDPLSFSGGMTTCEALFMGVPVVTLPEEKPASRQTLSFLTQLGLTDLLAVSEDDYVAKAAALAQDPDRLADLRRSLRPRMQASPLCQPVPFAAALEALIRQMWRRWCEGRLA